MITLEQGKDLSWWFWLFFFLGLMGIVILAIGWKQRLALINFSLGFIFWVLAVQAILVAGLLISESVKIGDICE